MNFKITASFPFKTTLPVRSACVSMRAHTVIKNCTFSISCFYHLMYLEQLRMLVLFSVQYEHFYFSHILLNKLTKRCWKNSLLNLRGNNHNIKLPCVVLGFVYFDSFPPSLVQIYLKLYDFPPSKYFLLYVNYREYKQAKRM